MLGPGIVMAGAAIGTSHLVQATRAGADYGYQLLIIVVLVNLFKYPFFEFGHRYLVSTRENLVDGYLRMGRPFLYGFVLFALISSIVAVAGVSFVTASIAGHLFGSSLGATGWSALVMAACVVILTVGHYRWLDHAMKGIMAVLFLATLAAFLAAVLHGPVAPPGYEAPSAWTVARVGFVIALMGWMPAPIEISVMQSLWLQARERSTGQRATIEAAALDFNVGYGLTVILALMFLMLGALVMHGSGIEVASAGATFAGQLIQIYRDTLGAWVGPLVGVAALTTMFSTTLAVIDGYPRCLTAASRLLAPGLELAPRRLHGAWMAVICLPALLITNAFINRLTDLVDLATTLSFLTAPFFAYLNFRLISASHIPQTLRPGPVLRGLSWIGLMFLTGFSALFLVYRFLPGLLD